MGLEILRHCPAHLRRDLHAIFVPIGGGGDSLMQPYALFVLPPCTHLPLHPQRYIMLFAEAVEGSCAHEGTVMQACRPEALGVQAWRPALRRW